MIWYCYCCYPLFWCVWRSMYSESFHRVREWWLWERESLRWRCQTETVKAKVVVSGLSHCLSKVTVFQSSLRFARQMLFKEGTIQHVVNKLSETFHPHCERFQRTMTWFHTYRTGKAGHHFLSSTALPVMPQFTWILESSYQTATQGRCLGTSAGQLENGKCGGAKHITSHSVWF